MKVNARSHTGKIGHLPYEIRCQLGFGIRDGIPGVRLVAWLNSFSLSRRERDGVRGSRPLSPKNHPLPAALLEYPNPKSTMRYPKSTVDLGLEPLIWGKNTLQTPPLPCRRHPFRPITTREWKHVSQNQTKPDQKMNRLQPLIWVESPLLKTAGFVRLNFTCFSAIL
jgi:hypothetical protein